VRSRRAGVLQPGQDRLEHLPERHDLLAVHLIEDQPPDGGHVPGRRRFGRHDSTADLPEPFAAHEAAPWTRQPIGDLLLPARPEPELAAA
jgi:hypothetical protein